MDDDGVEAWRATLLDVWRAGQALSAVGPGPVAVHLDHSAALAAELDPPERAVDLGSGAGIPGLALAGLWPGSEWLLVDASRRRVQLLRSAVRRLGWERRVHAVHDRAEDLARRERWRTWADLVVARSFGPPAATAECGVGFLRPGGILVVTEPPEESTTERWPVEGLRQLGLSPLPSPSGDAVRVQRLVLDDPVDPRWPRRTGVPTRRPLF